ncbi:MAG: geranylgeranylglyceryl/heptaprenylglyceryl phosphate synthase [Candidatus Altiarchaeia archaeon]
MNYLEDLIKKQGKAHFTLIDPENQSPEDAGMRAKICRDYGSSAIMIGGSTVRDGKTVYKTIDAIKKQAGLPTILFPNSAHAISENADYIFYMMLMNSTDRRFLLGEQIKAVPSIKKWNVKPIAMGYIVVSMSKTPTTVEKVACLDRIGEEDVEKAVNYALAAKYLNLQCVYLEAGSGAEKPVPNGMIKAVRKVVDIPIIVGGGIRDGKTAKEKTDAGADIIVNGSVSEENSEKIKGIIEAIKKP